MCSAQVWGLSPPERLQRCCPWRLFRLSNGAGAAIGFDHHVGPQWVLCMRADATHALYGSAPYRLYHSYGVPWVCRKRAQRKGRSSLRFLRGNRVCPTCYTSCVTWGLRLMMPAVIRDPLRARCATARGRRPDQGLALHEVPRSGGCTLGKSTTYARRSCALFSIVSS